MLYKLFRYWFYFVTLLSTYLVIKMLFIDDNSGQGFGGLGVLIIVPVLTVTAIVSLCLAVFVAKTKKYNEPSTLSTTGDLFKISILSLAFIITASYIILGVVL